MQSFKEIYVSLRTRRSNYLPQSPKRSCQNDHTAIRIKPLTALNTFALILFFIIIIQTDFFPLLCISTAAFNLTHRCTSCNTGSVNFCPASSALSSSSSQDRNPQYLRFIFQDVEAKWSLPTVPVFLLTVTSVPRALFVQHIDFQRDSFKGQKEK